MQTEKTRANPRPDSQILTVRIDSKLRYAAELAARRQRRTLSSFIQSALEQATREVTLAFELDIDMENMGKKPSAYEFAERSWDVNGLSRLFYLAAAYPHLLDHKEEILWSYYREFRGLGGRYDPKLVTETEQLEQLKESQQLNELVKHFADWLKKRMGTSTVDEFGVYFQESKKRRTRKSDDLAKED